MHIEISHAHYQELLHHTQSAYPLEACGLMAGQDYRVRRLYPIDNIRQSPYEYEMDPVEQLDAFLDLEQRGWELIAIYHSHPQGPQVPSATDVAQAYYPEAGHIIVSLLDNQQPRVRAFTIISGQVTEIPLRLV
jgi:proteasome lid subunit RPN8/RPN11